MTTANVNSRVYAATPPLPGGIGWVPPSRIGVHSYSVAAVVGNLFVPVVPALNVLSVWPIFQLTGGRVDQISFEITVGAVGSLVRVGIYRARNMSVGDIRPGGSPLLATSGDIDCAVAGTKTAAIDFRFEPGILYWGAFLFGIAAPTGACSVARR